MTRLEGADLKVSLSVEPGWTIRASQGDEFVRLAAVPVAFDSLIVSESSTSCFSMDVSLYVTVRSFFVCDSGWKDPFVRWSRGAVRLGSPRSAKALGSSVPRRQSFDSYKKDVAGAIQIYLWNTAL